MWFLALHLYDDRSMKDVTDVVKKIIHFPIKRQVDNNTRSHILASKILQYA